MLLLLLQRLLLLLVVVAAVVVVVQVRVLCHLIHLRIICLRPRHRRHHRQEALLAHRGIGIESRGTA